VEALSDYVMQTPHQERVKSPEWNDTP